VKEKWVEGLRNTLQLQINKKKTYIPSRFAVSARTYGKRLFGGKLKVLESERR